MKRNQQSIKFFLVLTLCTAFIFSFSHFGAKAFGMLAQTSEGYLPGTFIASTTIEGKNENEALTMLNEKYSEWFKSAEMKLKYKEKNVLIDIQNFHFQIEESILNIKDGQQNHVIVTLGQVQIKEMVSLISTDLNETQIDIDKLTNQLVRVASTLKPGEVLINLDDFLIAGQGKEVVILGEAVIKTKDVPDFEVDNEGLSKINIPAQSTFSLLEYLEKLNLIHVSQSTLNIMASGIYKAVLQTNLSIIERHIGEELPNYAELGFESKIDNERKIDLVISNPNANSYTIELDWNSQGLYVSIIGESLLYDYKVNVRDEQYFTPKTIKQYSGDLSSGQKKVKLVGSDGSLIRVYREIYENDKLIDSVLISEDFYPPVPRIEIHALPTVVIQPENGGVIGDTAQPDGSSIEQPAIPNGIQGEISDTIPNSNETSGNQSIVTPQTPGTSDDDLWGKSNEEPK